MWREEELTWRLISLNHCTLKEKQKDTLRVVVYCRTLMICADLFSHFSYEMSKSQYYPPNAPERSENRLFGLFHASTPQHSKDVIMGSLQDCHGTIRVVFASVAMGMGIDLHGVDTIIHYGALSSIEDYFQSNGRRGKVEIQLTPLSTGHLKIAKLVTG